MKHFSPSALAVSCCVLVVACVAQVGEGPDDEGASDLVASGLRATRVTRDFHVLGYRCPGGGDACGTGPEQCICQLEHDHLNAVRVLDSGAVVGHHVVTGGDARRAQIEGQGNRLAVNINELNRDWQEGGSARADAMMQWARRQFSGGVPQWFFLNEISRGRWLRSDAEGTRYRQYVVDVARRLARYHGRSVVVFSPFWRPGFDGTHHYPASWAALADDAYIGIENYIPGSVIAANGFSESFCRSRYQASIDAYSRLGVPRSRQMLTEHFGSTEGGTSWGRAGVGVEAWLRAIRVRTRAARSLPFAGYVSYAWGANKAHRPSAERVRAMDAFLRVGARRLALPDHSAAPPTGADEEYDPSSPAEPDPAVEPAGEPEGSSAPAEPTEPSDSADPGEPVASSEPEPSPPPGPTCEPRTCGAGYMDYCGGAADGCGATLSCGDTCGDGLNCNPNGVCKKALAQPCAGPGQCASGLCAYTTNPGSAARCCHAIGGWCNSDLKCCFDSVCRSGRCVAPRV